MVNLLHWEKGRIKQPLRTWESPTMRRIPRIAIERRAKEVDIKMWAEGSWILFAETHQSPGSIYQVDQDKLIRLNRYGQRYVFPDTIGKIDGVEYLKKTSVIFFIHKHEGYILVKKTTKR